MNKIFRKIRVVFQNKIKALKLDYEYRLRAIKTAELRKAKITDYQRWSKAEEFYEDWDERTVILANLIKPGSRIIEFGAGNMTLKKNLPINCSYTPSDIYKRNEETLVCDLNGDINMDLSKYDTAVFSGVLEYVYDIDSVFKQLENKTKRVVLSYACTDISNADRLKRGWLSDYERLELESIFSRYRYQITSYKEWKNQSIYSLEYNRNRR